MCKNLDGEVQSEVKPVSEMQKSEETCQSSYVPEEPNVSWC